MSVPAELVKKLRDQTSCGIKDCKKALTECDNDLEKAIEFLRKKGLADANKKMGRTTNAGRVFSYIHSNGSIGVMLELNCETDFVADTDAFQELGKDLCMQICAMNPVAVSREDIDEKIIEAEKNIYKEQMKDKLEGKPEKVIENILTGKLDKYFKENVLLEQNFIKEDKRSVEDIIKEKIASIKENISIKRFTRYQLGDNQSWNPL